MAKFDAGGFVGVRDEPTLLTPTQLSTHLACAHYTQLERKRRAGELEVVFMADPRLEAMRSRGAEHERAYIERLRQSGASIVDLSERKDPRATLAAMREGAHAIVQAPLGSDDFSGIADVLLRVEEPSALGAYSYESVEQMRWANGLCRYREVAKQADGFVRATG